MAGRMEPKVGKTHCSHVSSTDADLVAAARSGDAAAFRDSVEAAHSARYRLAFTMLRNRDDGEDAVQEAALNAWRLRTPRACAPVAHDRREPMTRRSPLSVVVGATPGRAPSRSPLGRCDALLRPRPATVHDHSLRVDLLVDAQVSCNGRSVFDS